MQVLRARYGSEEKTAGLRKTAGTFSTSSGAFLLPQLLQLPFSPPSPACAHLCCTAICPGSAAPAGSIPATIRGSGCPLASVRCKRPESLLLGDLVSAGACPDIPASFRRIPALVTVRVCSTECRDPAPALGRRRTSCAVRYEGYEQQASVPCRPVTVESASSRAHCHLPHAPTPRARPQVPCVILMRRQDWTIPGWLMWCAACTRTSPATYHAVVVRSAALLALGRRAAGALLQTVGLPRGL